ncbi:SIS domain-containing protein [Arsenophonus apicola]|jgi:arabinose-5-phosphate isomerase|uniref:KpsF/GutQ family sugar-phosphate isomerase n=1 Tax=Arsenophonus apicola TaxID=2879119 RepID=UPI003879D856
MDYLSHAKLAIHNEIEGIKYVESKLDDNFNKIIDTIHFSSGRVVMCGMGKSGHIAKKIFATLVSTGTPSLFMHPAEAYHGDLGMIKKEDIFFVISNSGETSEVTQLLPFINRNGNILISMTGNSQSTIAKSSTFHIDIRIEREACPLNLAPTTSTTASLVIGDAIAIALMHANNFRVENFAQYHPGGALGKKLLSTVREYTNPAIFVSSNTTLIDILTELSRSYSGTILVGNEDKLYGVITDGDIRKKLLQVDKKEIFDITAKEIMTIDPKTTSANTKCNDANMKMERHGINSLVVIENGKVFGIYDNLNRKR